MFHIMISQFWKIRLLVRNGNYRGCTAHFQPLEGNITQYERNLALVQDLSHCLLTWMNQENKSHNIWKNVRKINLLIKAMPCFSALCWVIIMEHAQNCFALEVPPKISLTLCPLFVKFHYVIWIFNTMVRHFHSAASLSGSECLLLLALSNCW